MSEIFVLARLRVMASDAQLMNYRDQMRALAPNLEGLKGFSAWRSVDEDGGVLQILRYVDQTVADSALKSLIESKVGPLVASFTIDPPDVVLVTPKHQKGLPFEEVAIGAQMSFVIRFSDPGQQEDLEMDTDLVLNELAYIPGYLGSFWGNNVALNEEIISIVTWKDRESLQKSIPNGHRMKLQRWQKAF